MAKYTLLLRTDRQDERGRHPVLLRINVKKTRTYLTLGVAVRARDWHEERQRARASADDARQINAYLTKALAAAEADEQRRTTTGEPVTADALRAAVAAQLGRAPVEEDRPDFIAFARGIVEQHRARGRERNARKQEAVLNKLIAVARQQGMSVLPPSELTPPFVRAFETYLVSAPPSGLGNSRNTANMNVRILRTWCRTAIGDGMLEKDPTAAIKLKEEPVQKERLTVEEIDLLASLGASEGVGEGASYQRGRRRNQHQGKDPALLGLARDMFLFSLYLAGIRSADTALLRWSDFKETPEGPRLLYRMGKNTELVSIPLVPPAAVILERYAKRRGKYERVFPLADAMPLGTPVERVETLDECNTLLNKSLDVLAKIAGVEKKVRFHIARHSFADLARRKGWSVTDIQYALRHSNPAITARYISSFDGERLDERMRSLF